MSLLFDLLFDLHDKMGRLATVRQFLGPLISRFALIELVQGNPLHRMVKDSPVDFQTSIGCRLGATGFNQLAK